MGRRWDYRVVVDFGTTHSIREVYYDVDDNIEGWTAIPWAPIGESRIELQIVVQQMRSAFAKPIIDISSGKAVEISGSAGSDRVSEQGNPPQGV